MTITMDFSERVRKCSQEFFDLHEPLRYEDLRQYELIDVREDKGIVTNHRSRIIAMYLQPERGCVIFYDKNWYELVAPVGREFLQRVCPPNVEHYGVGVLCSSRETILGGSSLILPYQGEVYARRNLKIKEGLLWAA